MDCLGRHNFNGTISTTLAFIAQVVERSLGKTEVSGSSPDEGSLRQRSKTGAYSLEKHW